MWIPKDFPKTPKHKIQFCIINNDSLDPSLYIVIGFCESKMFFFSLEVHFSESIGLKNFGIGVDL